MSWAARSRLRIPSRRATSSIRPVSSKHLPAGPRRDRQRPHIGLGGEPRPGEHIGDGHACRRLTALRRSASSVDEQLLRSSAAKSPEVPFELGRTPRGERPPSGRGSPAAMDPDPTLIEIEIGHRQRRDLCRAGRGLRQAPTPQPAGCSSACATPRCDPEPPPRRSADESATTCVAEGPGRPSGHLGRAAVPGLCGTTDGAPTVAGAWSQRSPGRPHCPPGRTAGRPPQSPPRDNPCRARSQRRRRIVRAGQRLVAASEPTATRVRPAAPGPRTPHRGRTRQRARLYHQACRYLQTGAGQAPGSWRCAGATIVKCA